MLLEGNSNAPGCEAMLHVEDRHTSLAQRRLIVEASDGAG